MAGVTPLEVMVHQSLVGELEGGGEDRVLGLAIGVDAGALDPGPCDRGRMGEHLLHAADEQALLRPVLRSGQEGVQGGRGDQGLFEGGLSVDVTEDPDGVPGQVQDGSGVSGKGSRAGRPTSLIERTTKPSQVPKRRRGTSV